MANVLFGVLVIILTIVIKDSGLANFLLSYFIDPWDTLVWFVSGCMSLFTKLPLKGVIEALASNLKVLWNEVKPWPDTLKMDSGDDESSHYDYDSDDESSHYDDDSDDEKLEPKMIRAKRLAKKLDAIEKEINSIEIGTQGTQKNGKILKEGRELLKQYTPLVKNIESIRGPRLREARRMEAEIRMLAKKETDRIQKLERLFQKTPRDWYIDSVSKSSSSGTEGKASTSSEVLDKGKGKASTSSSNTSSSRASSSTDLPAYNRADFEITTAEPVVESSSSGTKRKASTSLEVEDKSKRKAS